MSLADRKMEKNERFGRTRTLLGEEAFARVQTASVVVCGLGAVGGYAIEALVRAGIGALTLIDFDEIRLSNFNRQILATEEWLGRLKVEAAEHRIRQINPQCRVEALRQFIDADTIEDILERKPCYLIDAIDSVSSKASLIEGCQRRGIKVVSSMGAALRRDPLAVRLGNLSEVNTCPLARQLKKYLRRRGCSLDFPCVYSTEPVKKGQGLIRPGSTSFDPPLLDRGRVRNSLGSSSTITGIFGLVIANHVIESISSNNT